MNKKSSINAALDRNKDISPKYLAKIKKRFLSVCSILGKLKLKDERFVKKITDFYSIFWAIAEIEKANYIFNKKAVAQINHALTNFSYEVAKIIDKKGIAAKKDTQYYKYWMTTQQDTDSEEHRLQRSEILKEILLRSLSKKRDKNRFFSKSQKEQVWYESDKKCSFPTCKKTLQWETATVDHIIPWIHGGPTDVSNAQVMCRQHNSMKKDKDFSKYFIVQK